jgi:hypothetical protein
MNKALKDKLTKGAAIASLTDAEIAEIMPALEDGACIVVSHADEKTQNVIEEAVPFTFDVLEDRKLRLVPEGGPMMTKARWESMSEKARRDYNRAMMPVVIDSDTILTLY